MTEKEKAYELIIHTVCKCYGIERYELCAGNKTEINVEARSVIFTISKTLIEKYFFKCSSNFLGVAFGKDHATVLYGVKECKKRQSIYPKFAEKYNQIFDKTSQILSESFIPKCDKTLERELNFILKMNDIISMKIQLRNLISKIKKD